MSLRESSKLLLGWWRETEATPPFFNKQLMADKKIRSIAKTFSWRALIFIYWMLFGYIFTGSIKVASVLGVGSIVPLFFYYFHERVWNKIKWGTNTD